MFLLVFCCSTPALLCRSSSVVVPGCLLKVVDSVRINVVVLRNLVPEWLASDLRFHSHP